MLNLEVDAWAIKNQKIALGVFCNAAIERHHFHRRHEPLECPAPDCDTWFERPEEHTTQLAILRKTHDKSYHAPEPYQSLFADAKKRLDQEEQHDLEMLESYLEWLGERDSEQRKLAEKEFLRKLEQDSLHVQEEPLVFTRRWFDRIYPWDDEGSMRGYIQQAKNRAKLE